MPEALTESFCERCGTRYEFETVTELNPLRKTRGLISGLRNYIMSQDALGDAIGDAMRGEEQRIAATQLEAFHSAFNFCIQCRQYACTNCWNDAAGRCRTCAPIPGKDDLTDRLEAAYAADHAAMHAAEPELAVDEISRRLGVEAWPERDLPEDAVAAADASAPPGDLATEPVMEPVAESPEPVAADATEEPMAPTRILGWDEDADVVLQTPIDEALPEPDEVWATDAEPVEVAAETEPVGAETEPVAAEPVAAEPVEAEAEPVAAEAEPIEADAAPVEAAPVEAAPAADAHAPEPEASTPERVAPRPIRPIAETVLRAPSPPAREPAPVDDDALAARKAQLDLLGLDDPGVGEVRPERPRVLPYRSSGAAPRSAEALRQTVASNAMWAASAKEVAGGGSAVAVQSCGSCGLSLSANARFCRRCGTRQAQSA